MLKAVKFGGYRLKEDTEKLKKCTKMFTYKVTGPKAELAEFLKFQKSRGFQAPLLPDGSVLYTTAYNKVNNETQLEMKYDGSGYNHFDRAWEDFVDSVSAIEDEQIKAVYINKQINNAITSTRAVVMDTLSDFDDDGTDEEEPLAPQKKVRNS